MASVLLVDDEQDSRELMAKFMRRAGLIVYTAPNGADALKLIIDRVQDVIVLDVMMPTMNGVELMQVLRSYMRWRSIPVILVTAYPSGPHIETARELGMACLFEKPHFLLADLLACVQKLVSDPNAICTAG